MSCFKVMAGLQTSRYQPFYPQCLKAVQVLFSFMASDYFVGSLIRACRCGTLWCDLGVMFDFSFAKMFSAAMVETYFYHKDIWICVTDYCVSLYLIVQPPLTAIFQE